MAVILLALAACNPEYGQITSIPQQDTAVLDTGGEKQEEIQREENQNGDALTVDDVEDISLFDFRLSWDDTHEDLDLHLVAQGGQLWSPLTDCYFADCLSQDPELDWADPDDLLDDPHLLGDNVLGSGPEDAVFYQVPHDFEMDVYICDHPGQDHPALTQADLQEYVGGRLTVEMQIYFSGEGACMQMLHARFE